MSDVLIIERPQSCHIFCSCGFVAFMRVSPDTCPRCGARWENPKIEEYKHVNQPN